MPSPTVPVEPVDNASVTIMVVDDDPDIELRVRRALCVSGYQVVTATNGADACSLVREAHPDLIIMDLMLPDTDGLMLTQSFQTRTQAPILICSARQQQLDRVLGFKFGAADFLAKPFDMDELEARVEAILRRTVHRESPAASTEQIEVGDLCIARSRGTVKIGGAAVHLTPTEFHLLLMLASRVDTVVPRETLIQQIWGYPDLTSSHLVDVHIGRLRAKLRAVSPDREYVVLVRGRGYRLTADTQV